MALLHRARLRVLFIFTVFLAGLRSASSSLRLSFVIAKRGPIMGADGDDDEVSDDVRQMEEEDDQDEDVEDEGKDKKDDKKKGADEPEKVHADDEWRIKSRKNETRAKKAEREAKEAKQALAKREEADQSETEKAISAAEKKGRQEAESAAEKERKGDRLEVAVTRLASKRIKLGDGDDAEEARFADPEDAQLHIERAISRGDIDAEDIFNKEGRVDSDALQTELVELLKRKPHLKESVAEAPATKGDPDTRKGDPVDKDLEKLTPEDHAKRKYGSGK